MMDLSKRKCEQCAKGTPPLKNGDLKNLVDQVPGWTVVDEHHLEKEFTFPDFKQALEFVNQVGKIAEEEKHHPDIYLSWGKVKIILWTHKLGGLSENDFILAAKIDTQK